MSLWRHVTRGLRVLFNRAGADSELDDEIRHYVEEAERAALARGLSPADARRAAAREIGNIARVREEVRSFGWEQVIGTSLADVRYAARRLRHTPGFSAVGIVTLAIGIGATTAIAGAVRAVLLEPLPYREAGRIVMISDVITGGEPLDVTFGTYRELAQRSRTFEALAPFKAWQPTLVGGSEPERLVGERVGAEFFQALGVAPFIGRDLRADEDRPNGPNVAILSYDLWRRRFGADPSIVGRSITLDDVSYLVAGVMPREFENVLAPSAELWAPLQYSTVFGPESREWGHHLRLVGRLRPGVTIDAARRELNEIARAPVPEFARVPWAQLTNGLMTTSLQSHVTRGIRPALLAIFGAVLLLLAIACVNVTNLLLARGAQRRAEFSLRLALGAARGRLIRHVLTESMLLSLVGGVVAIAVAALGVQTLVAMAPRELPRIAATRVDGTVFLFALALTAAAGALVGLIPALHTARQDPHPGTHPSPRTAGGHQRARRLLVIAEVAFALVLLTGTGLLLRSITRVLTVPVGFDAPGLLTMQVQLSVQRYADTTAQVRFYADALDAIRAVPGVEAADCTSLLPLSGAIDVYGVHFERDGDVSSDGAAMRYAVTPGYFELMKIPLRSGRLLDARDTAHSARAVVINESFARRRFPGSQPLGQRLRFGPTEGDWYTIVGVVGDVRQSALDLSAPDALYVTPQQWHWVDRGMTIVVRGQGDAAALAPSIRRAIWSVDKDIPVVRIATMDALLDRAVADRRFALALFKAFGIAALVLVTTGLFGVLSGSVTERMREIGVRSALGASPRAIARLVLGEALTLVIAGVAVGLACAVIASRALETLLFAISPVDPISYAGAVALLLGASAIACSTPTYRAASVEPSVILRAE